MGYDFTLEDRMKGSKRGLKTRQKNATKKYENELIATLQQIEIDKANDLYRKGKIYELLNNLPENEVKKYTVQKKGLSEKNMKLVLQHVFKISIIDKDKKW